MRDIFAFRLFRNAVNLKISTPLLLLSFYPNFKRALLFMFRRNNPKYWMIGPSSHIWNRRETNKKIMISAAGGRKRRRPWPRPGPLVSLRWKGDDRSSRCVISSWRIVGWSSSAPLWFCRRSAWAGSCQPWSTPRASAWGSCLFGRGLVGASRN